jgi:hypothetical protein
MRFTKKLVIHSDHPDSLLEQLNEIGPLYVIIKRYTYFHSYCKDKIEQNSVKHILACKGLGI